MDKSWSARLLFQRSSRQIVEGIAFKARVDQRIDKRSGVSQRLPISCLENVVSNAERRAIVSGDSAAVARIADIYAAMPAITGKIELEYEGELKGAETIARDLIKQSVLMMFRQTFPNVDFKNVIEYFEMGGNILSFGIRFPEDRLWRNWTGSYIAGSHDRRVCRRRGLGGGVHS